MDPNQHKAPEEIFKKYLEGRCSREEIQRLLEFFEIPHNEKGLKTAVLHYLEREEPVATGSPSNEALDNIYRQLMQKIDKTEQESTPVLRKFRRMRVAAVLALGLCAAGVFWYLGKDTLFSENPAVKTVQDDVPPGTDRAVLTLADGSSRILDEVATGELAREAGTRIVKTGNGILEYTPRQARKAAPRNEEPVWNRIQIPPAGQYRLTLSDGTRVWLNAASALRFPVEFIGTERTVELSGEAYFEVAEDKTRPFRVSTDKQVVEVLGTSFNINAYENEALVTTTLVEGRVQIKVPGTAQGCTLAPGKASLLDRTAGELSVQDSDPESALDWKNGDFVFQEEDLQSIMRRVARWYDIEVVYDGEDSSRLIFNGWVSRSKPLSAVLRTMELTGKVRFNVKGRRVTVMSSH